MTSIECLKEALRLHEEAPDAKVVFMVNNEETCDPCEYRHTQQEPVDAELIWLWDDDESCALEQDDAICKIYDRIETGDSEADDVESLRIWKEQRYQAIVIWLGAK